VNEWIISREIICLLNKINGDEILHKSNGGFEFWDKEKDNILNLYFKEKLSTIQIGKIYNCDGSTIQRQFKRWDIKLRKRYNGIYEVDENYFSTIDTEEKAYWLGLLLADGHISKRNKVMLCMKDLDEIEKFKKSLKSTHPIKYNKDGNPSISIGCKQLCDDLRNIGFTNRKSYKIDINRILSFIPKELLNHFVRGMFDGDGSIKVYHYNYLKNPQYHFGYTGTKETCIFIQNYLEFDTKIKKEGDYTYTCVTRNFNKIKEIYYILYKDANIYLDRKYKIFINEIIK